MYPFSTTFFILVYYVGDVIICMEFSSDSGFESKFY